VKEYCNYHFGAAYGEEIGRIAMRLEDTLSRSTRLANGTPCDYPSGKPEGLHTYVFKNAEAVGEIARDMAAIHQRLPKEVVSQWRYQQIYLRALGDEALVENGGVPNEVSDGFFSRLVPLYHAEQAFYFVSPVTRKSILENRGEGV
jgi:hypothetical protein